MAGRVELDDLWGPLHSGILGFCDLCAALAVGGWTGGIALHQCIPPGARLGLGCLSWGGKAAKAIHGP